MIMPCDAQAKVGHLCGSQPCCRSRRAFAGYDCRALCLDPLAADTTVLSALQPRQPSRAGIKTTLLSLLSAYYPASS